MRPEQFIHKWQGIDLAERATAQSHFHDLCELLGEPKPLDADPKGEWYAFEKGATKTTGGEGWADVFKKGHFAWEYKRKGSSLDDALDQLKRYALALDNPPLLIVSDLARIRIVTNWTNAVSARHELELADLADPDKLRKLKWAFTDPERLKPGQTRQQVTEIAASKFAEIARDLRAKGHDPQAVAHFVNRLVFCMFAEDIGLLPKKMFSRMVTAAAAAPERFQALASQLFAAMRKGGMVGFEEVAWFDGGLFDDDLALPLAGAEIARVLEAAEMDWSEIDPSIMGTLFERGLDPNKRSQLGAHYTDRDKIMLIIEPVIARPLAAEWSTRHRAIKERLEAAQNHVQLALKQAESFPELEDEVRRVRSRLGPQAQLELFEGLDKRRRVRGLDAVRAELRAAERALAEARRRGEADLQDFLGRVRGLRVLDPACGSGNFLYLALQTLKDLEHRAGIEAEALGLQRPFPGVGPEQLLGIEINPFAAELARVSVWIGEIQWMQRNGFALARNPVLRPLETIECRDALLDEDGTEAEWPDADVIIGNPPFLGGKLLRDALGDATVDTLFARYAGRVPPEADLVCYWFVKAREAIVDGPTTRAGLVATNSIRGGANRRVLERIRDDLTIFDAWDDEPWTIDGAAVRVSLVSFARRDVADAVHLDGVPADEIHSDLTARRGGFGADLTSAARLAENASVAFMGDTKGGAFDISGDLARVWLKAPLNPNGRPNSEVLRPWFNGLDLTRRPRDMWIIDFGSRFVQEQAALYQLPFQHLLSHVYANRQRNNREAYRRYWWRHVESRPKMRKALDTCRRFIATPTVAKYRLFVWLPTGTCPDHQLIVIARDDDTTFGILHSRFHELWSLRLGTSLEDRPRYTPSTTFETFPFPEGLTPNLPAAAYADDPRAMVIAAAAARLSELREAWLNPADLVLRVPEVVPGYPDRLLPKDEAAAKELRKRTLTNLYNQRPAWLDQAHRALDAAVAAAYGWPADLGDDEILKRLLALNQERARAGR